MIAPVGNIVIEEEAQVPVALLRGGAVGKFLGGQVAILSLHIEPFAHPVHQGHPFIGSLHRGNQQALIAAVDRIGGGEGSVATQAIGEQKAAFLAAGQVPHLLFAVKKPHTIPPLRQLIEGSSPKRIYRKYIHFCPVRQSPRIEEEPAKFATFFVQSWPTAAPPARNPAQWSAGWVSIG